MEKKELLMRAVRDAVGEVCWHGRKEDEELAREDVRRLLDGGHVTAGELGAAFAAEVLRQFPKAKP